MANDAQMPDVRRWDYYPIEMPVTADGKGPATVGVDAARITYEVWDRDLLSHASYDNLPDAINEAMRLNAALPSDPAADLCASGQQVRALNRAVGDDRKAGWTLPVGVLSAIKQRVYRDDGEVVSLEAVEIIALEVERILASLTPAPQPELQECSRCGSVGGFVDELGARRVLRIAYAFDADETANEFLRDDGEGGFAAGVYRMAEEIRRLRADLARPSQAVDEGVEALVSFARPFADALDIECDFMTPPAPFEDGFDVRSRARAALADERKEGE